MIHSNDYLLRNVLQNKEVLIKTNMSVFILIICGSGVVYWTRFDLSRYQGRNKARKKLGGTNGP